MVRDLDQDACVGKGSWYFVRMSVCLRLHQCYGGDTLLTYTKSTKKACGGAETQKTKTRKTNERTLPAKGWQQVRGRCKVGDIGVRWG